MSETLTFIRGYLNRILLVVGCISVLTSWYFSSPQVDAIAQELQLWNVNIATFTLFVGIITIFSRYINTVMKREKYWLYQLYGMILIISWIIFGVFSGLYSNTYQVAYLSTKITLHIAILGQLVFFMISGAYRVFRIRTIRSTYFALLAVIVTLLFNPWISVPFPLADKLVFWLLENPAMAGYRALLISGAIGGVVLSIRLLLGVEKGALRATEKM